MSYQVLARKYRPASFQELEGQEHVLQALVNALDNERLHHAYLFTGTRGVGKTTIARILARCLNCETGVTSKPCGVCSTCMEISEGRSVDLIEVDAASRTGVDDMRELLDNVQYMPSVSRFKIYLIDEVHMLSKSSFNAMLKTLEEPPEHVKFLFATTDPKKLPITVLSRCLQFNLKNMSPEQIVHHLGFVLETESIAYDEAALWQLGHAADGSMRDALSLTDQAISFGNNEVREAPVNAMLGAIDHQVVFEILDDIVAGDGARLLACIAELSDFAPDYAALLDDILSVLHRVAIAHAVPDAVDNAQGDRELVHAAAQGISAEQVQLFYQIGLIGQRDLPLAPMPRTGFEMVLLRMMSFSPDDRGAETKRGSTQAKADPGGSASPKSASPIAALLSTINNADKPAPAASGGNEPAVSAEEKTATSDETATSEKKTSAVQPPAKESSPVSGMGLANAATNTARTAVESEIPSADGNLSAVHEPAPVSDSSVKSGPAPAPGPAPEINSVTPAPGLEPANWVQVLDALALSGVTGTLAANCQLESSDDDRCLLKLAEHHASLWNASHEQRIADALSRLYQREMKVAIEVGETNVETPAQHTERKRQENQAKAVAEIENDEHVQQLIENFNGRLDPESISPLMQAGEQ